MAKERKALQISCDTADCSQGLHCFRATKEMAAKNRAGVCRECGADLIDWRRVHQCDLQDVEYTFEALKYEWIGHHFWHKVLNQKAINHARRKGRRGLRVAARRHLEGAIGPAHPFRDGFQTTMSDDAPNKYSLTKSATIKADDLDMPHWSRIRAIPRSCFLFQKVAGFD
jgi:hypothetical protein